MVELSTYQGIFDIYMQKTGTQLSKVPQKINFLHKGSKRGGGRGGEVQRFFEKC